MRHADARRWLVARDRPRRRVSYTDLLVAWHNVGRLGPGQKEPRNPGGGVWDSKPRRTLPPEPSAACPLSLLSPPSSAARSSLRRRRSCLGLLARRIIRVAQEARLAAPRSRACPAHGGQNGAQACHLGLGWPSSSILDPVTAEGENRVLLPNPIVPLLL
jgi:hypothetical protein